MTKTLVSAIAFVSFGLCCGLPDKAHAQSPVLMEMYGRGVHAYHAGRYSEAYELLTLAIENGIEDPRAYYFRGIVAQASGRPEEAESDWQVGADLEAGGRIIADIGRSLTRVQGSTRLKLEQVRQTARLQASAASASRSEARYGEIRQAEGRVLQAPSVAVDPPPMPPAAGDDNPFRDDFAAGAEPTVEAEDALEGAVGSAKAEMSATPRSPAEAPAAGSPFEAAPAAGGDPFDPPGGDPFDSPAAGDFDPFLPAGGDDDPFGDDPFEG